MDKLPWGEPLAFILVGISIPPSAAKMCLRWKRASLCGCPFIPWAVAYENTQKAVVSRKSKSCAFP